MNARLALYHSPLSPLVLRVCSRERSHKLGWVVWWEDPALFHTLQSSVWTIETEGIHLYILTGQRGDVSFSSLCTVSCCMHLTVGLVLGLCSTIYRTVSLGVVLLIYDRSSITTDLTACCNFVAVYPAPVSCWTAFWKGRNFEFRLFFISLLRQTFFWTFAEPFESSTSWLSSKFPFINSQGLFIEMNVLIFDIWILNGVDSYDTYIWLLRVKYDWLHYSAQNRHGWLWFGYQKVLV